jgi:hypothetical protein
MLRRGVFLPSLACPSESRGKIEEEGSNGKKGDDFKSTEETEVQDEKGKSVQTMRSSAWLYA